MEIFAERLKYLRENLKLSQKEVAQRIHSTEVSISNYEKGTRTPSIDTLNELADCFGVTADYLLGRSKYPVANMKLEKVCDYTGLSPYALKLLNQCQKHAMPKILNLILSDKMCVEFFNYCEYINGCAAFNQSIKNQQRHFNKLSKTEINESNKEVIKNKMNTLLSNIVDAEKFKEQYEYKAHKFTFRLLKCFYGLSEYDYITSPPKSFTIVTEIMKLDEKDSKDNPDFLKDGFISAIDLHIEKYGDDSGNDDNNGDDNNNTADGENDVNDQKKR